MNLYLFKKAYKEYCRENKGAYYLVSPASNIKQANLSCYWSSEYKGDRKVKDIEEFIRLASPEQLLPITIRAITAGMDFGEFNLKLVNDPETQSPIFVTDGKFPKDKSKGRDKSSPLSISLDTISNWVEDVEDAKGRILDINDPVDIISSYMFNTNSPGTSLITGEKSKGIIRNWVIDTDIIADEIRRDLISPRYESAEEAEDGLLEILNDIPRDQVSDEQIEYDQDFIRPIRMKARERVRELFAENKITYDTDTNGKYTWVDVDEANPPKEEAILLPEVSSNILDENIVSLLEEEGLKEHTTITKLRKNISSLKKMDKDNPELYQELLDAEGITEDAPWAVVELLDEKNEPTGVLKLITSYNILKDVELADIDFSDSVDNIISRAEKPNTSLKTRRDSTKLEEKEYKKDTNKSTQYLTQENTKLMNKEEIVAELREKYKIELLLGNAATEGDTTEERKQNVLQVVQQLKQEGMSIEDIQYYVEHRMTEEDVQTIAKDELAEQEAYAKETEESPIYTGRHHKDIEDKSSKAKGPLSKDKIDMMKETLLNKRIIDNPDVIEDFDNTDLVDKSLVPDAYNAYKEQEGNLDMLATDIIMPNNMPKPNSAPITKADANRKANLERKEAILLDLYIRVASALRDGVDIDISNDDLTALDKVNTASSTPSNAIEEYELIDPNIEFIF